MLANVMYILPMLLGRTYDARNDRVGFDLFPQSELDRNRTLHEPESISRYETTESTDEVRKLLEVSGDLALKVKAGQLELKGTGSYLKDSSKASRSVEILTRLKFKTNTIALPPDVQPVKDWMIKYPSTKELGTHFVRSVTYGGELIASIRFRANQESDINTISGVVRGSFSSGEAGSLVAEGKLEKVQSTLKDQASMEISYYATVPLKDVPNTIEGLRTLVRDFDKHVLEVNNGWGVPIRVELMELDSLAGGNGSQYRFLKNRALEAELSDLEMEFDDLRTALARLTQWVRTLPPGISNEQEEDIGKLFKRIRGVLRPYYDVIGKMNVEEGTDQLQTAREAYREGRLSALPGKFDREVDKLKRKIVVDEKKLFGTGTSTYVHWGGKECPQSPMSTKLYTGYVSSSTNKGTGGASAYICLPNKTSFGSNNESFSGSDVSTILAGARYGLFNEHPFESSNARAYFGHGIPCAVCHLTNRTLVSTFNAVDECPDNDEEKKWNKAGRWFEEYSGYLISGANLPAEHICIDKDPEDYSQISDELQTHSIGLSFVGNILFPPNLYTPGSAIKCIVCSK